MDNTVDQFIKRVPWLFKKPTYAVTIWRPDETGAIIEHTLFVTDGSIVQLRDVNVNDEGVKDSETPILTFRITAK